MLDYYIWYSTIKFSFREKLRLLKEHKDMSLIYEKCHKGQLDESKKLQDTLLNSFNKNIIDEIKASMYKNNIKIVGYYDEQYPTRLRNFEEAPTVLYYKGDLEKLNKLYNVSIVGSRKCTSYGLNAAKLIASELSTKNINVISGMARGIDTAAHKASVLNNGYTCAVLGSGLDVIYPKENSSLFNEIVSSGCVISEFPPGTQPLQFHFPIRNRIISQLSDIVIVIEAGLKSGSLITARLALDLGIDVMALPGSIFSEQSKGSNKLIKDGAFPFTSLEDVYDLLNLKFAPTYDNALISSSFSSEEDKIIRVLTDNPIHLDEIIKLTKVDIKHLYEVLFELQLKEEILCLAGNYYVRNIRAI